MDLISLEDCQKVVEKCLQTRKVEVLLYEIKASTEAAAGFIGASKILHVSAKIPGKVVELNFFTKTLPENPYHRKNVTISKVFYKEAEFFKSIWPLISKYCLYKVAPTCYHVDADKLLVFENLATQGYRNLDSSLPFDLKHFEAVLERLASFHAASFLYEHSANGRFDEIFPHLHCDQIGWFKDEKGHPGYEHCQTGVRALGVVLDRYFDHVPREVRDKVKKLLASNPSLLLPSKKYHNALAHADLWCNNIMFKYDNDGRIEDCILVDYQLFGYCPPSVDVYSLIFIVTDKPSRLKHSKGLAELYYRRFSESIHHHGESPEQFLTWKEFNDSVSEAVPVALTNAAIFLHYVLLPQDELDEVFGDSKATREFMEVDRSSVVLKALEKDCAYRTRLLAALSDCVDYFTGNLVI